MNRFCLASARIKSLRTLQSSVNLGYALRFNNVELLTPRTRYDFGFGETKECNAAIFAVYQNAYIKHGWTIRDFHDILKKDRLADVFHLVSPSDRSAIALKCTETVQISDDLRF